MRIIEAVVENKMVVTENKSPPCREAPPEGGWGYIIVLATTIIMCSTIVPLGALGIIFGSFISKTGDDMSGLTLISSTFNTTSFFMGIFANVLLKKYSFRKVALLGSLIHFLGAVSTIFTSSLKELILTFGVLEGIGFGLLLPASFSAVNAYFEKRLALMMSISQTLMVVGYMVIPYLGHWSLGFYGYRGTLLLLAGLSLFNIPSSVALHPVKWYLSENSNLLLDEERVQRSLVRSLDLHFFTDVNYMITAIGLSLSFAADVAFFPIVPPMMTKLGFNSSEIALMLSVFFGADLAARICLSVISAFVPINSKLLVLVSSALSAVLRLGLVMNNSMDYNLVVLGLMGYLRCFIQTPQSLVISDLYPNNFESAYTVYMVMNGVVNLLLGTLMSYVKSITNSNIWACHVLTMAFLITVLSWSVELVACKRSPKNNEQ